VAGFDPIRDTQEVKARERYFAESQEAMMEEAAPSTPLRADSRPRETLWQRIKRWCS